MESYKESAGKVTLWQVAEVIIMGIFWLISGIFSLIIMIVLPIRFMLTKEPLFGSLSLVVP